MPWSPQKCEFCQKQYANKTGLRKHLAEYIGKWRLPADGIHDVSQIEQVLLRLSSSAHETDGYRKYQCWTCSEVISSRRRFNEHVVYRAHCGYQSSLSNKPKTHREQRHTWWLPFDETTVLLQQERFALLDLPLELRCLVYEWLFCFEEIKIGNDLRERDVEPHRSGLWLQHNPPNNPLAILSVNRQLYREARSTFFSLNTFTFESFEGLPVFLIGIGPENAKLLRSVRCRNKAGYYEDKVKAVQSCLRQAAPAGQTPTPESQLKHTEDLYLNLLDNGVTPPSYWGNNLRLVRPEIADVSAYPGRQRFTLDVTLRYAQIERLETVRKARVGFELYIQKRRKEE